MNDTKSFNIKLYVLFTLVVQTTALVLTLRFTRKQVEPYAVSTAVFLTEILKILICLVLLLHQQGRRLRQWKEVLMSEVISNPKETCKLLIPSGLYCLQNNLLYLALTYIDAGTYQVTYQLKILTTALFSVLMLGKSLSYKQWLSLLVLMIGVIFVQFPTPEQRSPGDINGLNFSVGVGEVASVDASNFVAYFHLQSQKVLGLMFVLFACFSSGFAGVYYEKLLKFGQQTSVVIRNIQLGIFSLFFGFVAIILSDWDMVTQKGTFHGYNVFVWTVIMMQATGGLIIAAAIKYADNILKGFATSISIVLSSLISYFVFNDLILDVYFIVGCFLVIFATFLYSSSQSKITNILNVQNMKKTTLA